MRGGGLAQIIRRVDKMIECADGVVRGGSFWLGESVYSGTRMTWELDGRWSPVAAGHPFDLLRRER